MKVLKIVFPFFLLTFLTAGSVFSQPETCLEKTCFENARVVAGSPLPLKGVANLEFLKFDMYTGALYAPESVKTYQDVLGDVPKALVLHYHRNIKVEWMNTAAEKIIKKNTAVDYAKIEERVKQIGKAYQRVGKDDRYALVYEPGKGTSLYLNDQFIVQIPGEDFQRAYFGIWLSEHPAKTGFRDKLLGA